MSCRFVWYCFGSGGHSEATLWLGCQMDEVILMVSSNLNDSMNSMFLRFHEGWSPPMCPVSPPRWAARCKLLQGLNAATAEIAPKSSVSKSLLHVGILQISNEEKNSSWWCARLGCSQQTWSGSSWVAEHGGSTAARSLHCRLTHILQPFGEDHLHNYKDHKFCTSPISERFPFGYSMFLQIPTINCPNGLCSHLM